MSNRIEQDSDQPFTITEEAVRLYLALAERHTERQQETGLRATESDDRHSTELAWWQLSTLQLVDGTVHNPVLRDPAPALRRMQRELRRRTIELEDLADRVHSDLERLSAVYRCNTGAPAGDSGDSIELLEGVGNINAAIDEACRAAEREVLCVQPGGGRPVEVLEEAMQRDFALLERGVRARTIYQHAARFSTPTRFYMERAVSRGAEVRTLDEFSDRLVVVDRATAFLPATADRQAEVAVRQPAVVGFLADMFERAWTRAIPFSKETGRTTLREAVDSTRLAIARLVVQGDIDAVCARRAGLSLRNYREHVRQLMAQLGVRSRSELGYQIARLGLLEQYTPLSVKPSKKDKNAAELAS
jgi:sugar-specific transcriptional regulator TrmB